VYVTLWFRPCCHFTSCRIDHAAEKRGAIPSFYTTCTIVVLLAAATAVAGVTMTKLAQITDRSAVTAWSPSTGHADVLAIGTKVRMVVVAGVVCGCCGPCVCMCMCMCV
jgi:hypothetical protein